MLFRSLRSSRQLTPAVLAQVSASQLINQGVSIIALADLQEWLLKHDLSLMHGPPITDIDFREARKAIALLDAFDFDTESLEWQMNHLARKRGRARSRPAPPACAVESLPAVSTTGAAP